MPHSSYTLYYSQPRLSHFEPQGVIWEKKQEYFTATDDVAATKIMCEFLGKEALVLDTGTHCRTCIRLVLQHPYRVVREYYPPTPTINNDGARILPLPASMAG